MAYNWNYDPRRPSPPPHMTSEYYRHPNPGTYLYPGYANETGLHRSRSQGHRPAPTVLVVNENVNESIGMRTPSRSPPYHPVGGSRYSPDGRGRGNSRTRLGDELVEEIAELVLDKERRRSRSRGRSDADFTALGGNGDFRDWELHRREREIADIRAREAWEREEKRLKEGFEAQRVKDEAKRKADADAAKKEKQRIIDDWEAEQREEKEKRVAEEKRLKEKFEKEARDAKEKEKKDWEDFLRRQRELEEKEKKERKEEKEKVDEAARKRLLDAGVPWATVERMMDEEKNKKVGNHNTTTTTTTVQRYRGLDLDLDNAQKYSKIHKRYLDVRTLKYYRVPYTLSSDPDYILITCNLDQDHIDVLCSHTRRLRAGDPSLLRLESSGHYNRKNAKEFSWFRRKDEGRGRSASHGRAGSGSGAAKSGIIVSRGGW